MILLQHSSLSRLALVVVVSCVLLATLSPAAAAVDAAAIARQGNGRGAAPCVACHGVDGAGQASAGFPRLAGLNAAYLQKQLDDYASGTRSHPVMDVNAKALSDEERKALAAYYSRLPKPTTQAQPADAPAADSVGALLATRGRWSERVPACEQCHGPAGIGVGEHFPPLAGQPAAYIASQLNAWKSGSRHNDPLELMRHLSAALSEQDIQSVAAWFAAQPADGTGAGP